MQSLFMMTSGVSISFAVAWLVIAQTPSGNKPNNAVFTCGLRQSEADNINRLQTHGREREFNM
jgi:hypothetical protein